MNPVLATSYGIMLLGACVWFGVFRRLGPIETGRGMRLLGASIVVVGFLMGLTQSEPLAKEGPANQAAPAARPAPPGRPAH